MRHARQTSGGIEQAKERHRDARAWSLARDLAQDVRYAWRSLRRAPAFTIVAVATLALGIGANAAMFSVLNTFLMRPLPYPQPDRLVRIFRTSIHSQSWPHSSANVLDYRQRNTVFDDVVPWNGLRQSLTGDGQAAEGLQGMSVTADFFPALGVPAAVGRWFTADEDQPGANQVAVLSDGFWRRRFGAGSDDRGPDAAPRRKAGDRRRGDAAGVRTSDSLGPSRSLAALRVHAAAAAGSRQ